MRCADGIMINRVIGLDAAAILSQRLACVGIDIEPGKIAAGNIDSNPVSLLEDIRGRERCNLDFVDLSRRHHLLEIRPVPVSGAQDTIRDIHVEASREICCRRIHINQLGGELRIAGG